RAIAAAPELVATVSADGVRLWSADLEERWYHPAPVDRAPFAVLSPDGRRLGTGGHAGALWLHDLDGGEPVVVAHPAEVKAMAFAPRGDRFATGSADGRLRVFAGEGSAPPERVIDAHHGSVEAIAFVDPERLVSGG